MTPRQSVELDIRTVMTDAGCKFKAGSLSGLLLAVSENAGQTADTAQEAGFRSGRQNSDGFSGNCESEKEPAQSGMPDRTKRSIGACMRLRRLLRMSDL